VTVPQIAPFADPTRTASVAEVIACEARSSSTLATSDSDEKRAKLVTACRALTAGVLCLATVWTECDRAGVSALWFEGLRGWRLPEAHLAGSQIARVSSALAAERANCTRK
jgi:hypothetical protein